MLARVLAPHLKLGDRVVIEGELGTGKTTLTQFLLETMGVNGGYFTSPTFAIMNQYEDGLGRSIGHLDCYRIQSEGELDESGITEYFFRTDTIIFCEWLSRAPALLKFLEQEKESRLWKVSLGFERSSRSGDDLELGRWLRLDWPQDRGPNASKIV